VIVQRFREHACGFTLVEVLVALVIVAFGMGAVLTALTSAADSETRLREKTFAEWVGLNQLATERLRSTQPATGTREGDATLAGMTWHWEETVENMDIPGIRRITIRVRQAEGGTATSKAPKPAADKTDWMATVMGFRGDAIFTPQTVLPSWDGAVTTAPSPDSPQPPQPPQSPQPPQPPQAPGR
jgi:general secretion pathway protein I